MADNPELAPSDHLFEATVIEVIHIRCRKGKGAESDVVRVVDYYFSVDGRLLAVFDGWQEEQE